MTKIFNARKTPLILLAMIIGILAGAMLPRVYSLVTYCVMAIAIIMIWKCKLNSNKKIFAFILLLFFAIAQLLTAITDFNQNNDKHDYANVTTQGRITVDSPFSIDNSVDFNRKIIVVIMDDLVIDGEKCSGKMLMKIDASMASDISIGDKVTFNAKVNRISIAPKDSYSISRLCDGIKYNAVPVFESEGTDYLWKVEKGKPKIIEQLRINLYKVAENSTDKATASFLYAMTVGDKQFMDAEYKDAFAVNGTAHLLAVSGLHIGILAGFFLKIMSKFKLNYWWKLGIIIPILLGYSAMCGFSASVIRASLMLVIYLISKAIGGRNDILSTISLSAIILLLIQPYNLFDIGFLMSYSAVIGIIMISKPVISMFTKVLPAKLASVIGVGLCANIGLFPIMLSFFGCTSLIFIITNLLCVPIVALFFPIYFIFAFIATFLPFMQVVISIIGLPFYLVNELNIAFAQINFLTLNFEITAILMVLYIAFLVFLSPYCLIDEKPKKIATLVIACVVLVSGVFSLKGITISDNTIITASGQGRYMLLKSYEKGNFLVCENIDKEDLPLISDLAKKANVAKLSGVICIDSDSDYLIMKDLYMALPYDNIYSRYDIYNCKFANNYNSAIIAEGMTVTFDTGSSVKINFDGMVIVWIEKNELSYDFVECDILIGENVNNDSIVSDYYMSDKNYNYDKNIALWGCKFNMINDRIIRKSN